MSYMKKPNGKSYIRFVTQEEIDEIKAEIKKKEEQKRWHTGTPTEEGWYLLHTKETIPYRVAYMRDNHWLSTSDSYIRTDIIIAWRKVEPYMR